MTPWRRIVLLLACSLPLLCGNSLRAAATATINAVVRDPSGTPVPDCPVEVVTPDDYAFGFTNAAGVASLTFRAGSEGARGACGVSRGIFRRLDKNTVDHALSSFKAIYQNFAIPLLQPFAVSAGQASADFEIQLREKVTITGRVVDAAGTPVVGTIPKGTSLAGNVPTPPVVGAHDWMVSSAILWSDSSGNFTLQNVPKGVDITLTVLTPTDVWPIDVAGQRTRADLNLGSITVVRHPHTSSAAIKTTNYLDLYDTTMANLGKGAVVVSDDGQVVLSFRVDEHSGSLMGMPEVTAPGQPITLPIGTYYASPGGIGARTSERLVHRVRAGEQAALDAAGVPKFTAVAGQTVTFTFDARAAYTAINGSPPIELPPPPAPPSPGP